MLEAPGPEDPALRSALVLSRVSPKRSSTAFFCVLWLAISLVVGCGGGAEPTDPRPSTGLSADIARNLLDPLEGFPYSVSSEDALRLERAYRALTEFGDAELALSTAQALLARDPELDPAEVLAAQVEYVARRYDAVVDRLEAVVAAQPAYTAAVLLLGSSLETLGDPVNAYQAYSGIAERADARDALDRLAAPVRQSLFEQVEGSVDRASEEARSALERLTLWFPEARETVGAEVLFARATGESDRELAALRRIDENGEISSQARRRMAALEVEVGDPTRGLEILEAMVARAPDDLDLRESLEAAKFSWRLNMLPAGVATLARAEELTRSEFAAFLYWVLPGVRSASPTGAQIATDVPLDHPYRQEVVRVVNLGVMPLADTALRRFAPERPAQRVEVAEILLRAPNLFGVQPACSREFVQARRVSPRAVCEAAVRCGLADELESCAVGGEIGGREMREMVRRTLDLMSGPAP